ncbi:hypothetical protein GCM10023322_24050 [Rugosimonospora acidiphila]|uniref:Transposase n=1 Tax=Rugosimonospora acidiphila TaxID=556531 RepID=A0ABP9RRT7_9ACTN
MTGPPVPEPDLYELPPERFIAARDEAIARARTAGDRALAARLRTLRRPTVAAWLVNLVALRRPEQIGELLDLGTELGEAQRQLRGERLRELSARRRAAVAGVVAQARRLAVEAGRRPRDPLPLAEVEATLAAALADEQVAEAVRAGRLTRTAGYAGFGETLRPDLRIIDGGAGAAEPPEPPAEPAEAGEPAGRTPRRRAEPGDRAGTAGGTRRTEGPAEPARSSAAGRPNQTGKAVKTGPAEKAAKTGPAGERLDRAGPRGAASDQAERERARARAEAARSARIENAAAALRRAEGDERDAARALAALAAELDRVRERHAAAQLALREGRLRRRAAERDARRALGGEAPRAGQ